MYQVTDESLAFMSNLSVSFFTFKGSSHNVTVFFNNFKYIFLLFSKFYKHLVKWALTEIEWSVAGTTTLDREWFTIICQNLKDVCIVFSTGGNLFIDGMELHLVSFSTYINRQSVYSWNKSNDFKDAFLFNHVGQ